MPSDTFSGAPDDGDTSEELEKALEEFVWTYRRRAADSVRELLDDWLDQGPERVALEAKTLEIFETSSDQIAVVLREALAQDEASLED